MLWSKVKNGSNKEAFDGLAMDKGTWGQVGMKSLIFLQQIQAIKYIRSGKQTIIV
jgi:hypothetical protein